MKLSLHETRVIGVLIEKETTTPDQYPMSLNSLTNACNQKTNRDPVLNLSEADVQETIDELTKKHLISEVRFGSRVPKFQHRFCNTEFSEYRFNKKELAIICVLFLRGPQTPGELRTRTNRLCDFSDVQETEAVLQGLIDHEKGSYVVKLERQPGKRESRYAHLFSGEVEDTATTQVNTEPTTDAGEQASSPPPQSNANTSELEERVEVLEMTVDDLQSQIDQLKELLDQLTS
jgi:uncharacterized protein YceH (UPF0502 family)